MKTRNLIPTLLSTFLLLAAPLVPAASLTWNGADTVVSGNGNWSDANNWVSLAVPTLGDTLTFTGAVGLQNTNDYAAGYYFNQLFFGAGGFVLQGGNALTLTNATQQAIYNNSAAFCSNVINCPLVLSNLLIIQTTVSSPAVGGSSITLNGGVTAGGKPIQVNKDGAGAGGAASVLYFSGGVSSFGNLFLRKGGVVINNGASVQATNATIGFDVTFNGIDPYLQVDGAGSKFLITNASAITLGGAANNAKVVVTDGLVALTNATVLFAQSASANVTWQQSGGTTVMGTLRVNNGTAAINLSGGSFTALSEGSKLAEVGSGVLTVSGGLFQIKSDGSGKLDFSTAATTSGNSTVNLNGGMIKVGRLVRTSAVVSGTHKFYFNGGTLQAGATTNLFFPVLINTTAYVGSGGAVLDTQGFNDTIGTPLLTDPALGGATDGGLTKLGSGTLTLTNVNTYNGPTLVMAGTLALGGPESIGNSASIMVYGGAAFDVSGETGAFSLGTGQLLGNLAPGAILCGANNTASGILSLAFDSFNPAVMVTNGTLNLSAATVLRLTNSGAALMPGAYKLIAAAGTGNFGLVTGAVPASVTISGGVNGMPSLAISNGELYLYVDYITSNLGIWSGAGTNGAWSNYANWSSARLPAAGGGVSFGSMPGQVASNDLANFSLSAIVFNTNAGAFTLTGNALTLTGTNIGYLTNVQNLPWTTVAPVPGTVVNFSSNAQTLALGLILQTNLTAQLLAGDLLFSGNISGPGGITTQGTNALTLSGSNSFAGGLTVNEGTLNLDFTTQNNNKQSSGAPLVLAGGNLNIFGAAGAFTQAMGGLTLNPGISRVTNASGNATLSLGTITRNLGAAVMFADSASGSIQTASGSANSVLGGYALFGDADWATKTSGNAVQAFAAYTINNGVGSWGAGQNLTDTGTGYIGAMGGNRSVNSLRFNAAGPATVNESSNTLTVATGGILVTPAVGAHDVVITNGVLASGYNADLIVHQNNRRAR